VQTFPKWSE
jgi:hypothetical protein